MAQTLEYLADLWEVVAQVPQAHLPTLAFALAAWALIRVLGRFTPRWPAVLIAVVVTTAVSAGIGFERKLGVSSSAVADAGCNCTRSFCNASKTGAPESSIAREHCLPAQLPTAGHGVLPG